MIHSVFVDGGVIKRNPSTYGGTWAYVFVDENDQEIGRRSGYVTPQEIGLPTITNNLTELLAAVNAMLHLPEDFAGTIHTDSFVTLCRITARNPKMNGIPDHLQDRMWVARKRLVNFGKHMVVQVDGHPTKDQLFKGKGKRGNPVSKFNVLCDDLCGMEARKFLKSLQPS